MATRVVHREPRDPQFVFCFFFLSYCSHITYMVLASSMKDFSEEYLVFFFQGNYIKMLWKMCRPTTPGFVLNGGFAFPLSMLKRESL